MSPGQLKNYYTVITDCWTLFKKFSEPVEGEEFWNSLIQESEELYNKHGKVNFSERMISVVIQEVENIYKEQADEKHVGRSE